ncbi:MSP domain protein [Dictyocaulus viviparus]|uniref:Major sperm protein n=1 Tax=Dictyocaulus viviparus TaxID=29172 RepID=A0A0D8XYG7_DICVI|nr:MSP domain protein [Dictyocaulus viviparus]
MIFTFQILTETSATVFSSFFSAICILSATISLLTICSSNSSASEESEKNVEQKPPAGSTSSTIPSKELGKSSTETKTSSQSKEMKKAPLRLPQQMPSPSLQQQQQKPLNKLTVNEQQRLAKNQINQGKLARKAPKKETVEAFTVQDNVTDFIEAARTTNLPATKKENAPPSDTGDGNYEDVNLAQAAPEQPRRVVTVDPTAARFPTTGGKSTFTVLNAGTEHVVFKVKCSNNKDYRIKPVYGNLDPGGTHLVWVVRLPAGVMEDRMVIQWLPAPPNVTDPAALFKTAKTGSIQSVVARLIGVSIESPQVNLPDEKTARGNISVVKPLPPGSSPDAPKSLTGGSMLRI